MKPLVIAHRGASAYAPENTLPAFNLAFEMGADGIELDVYLTRDGVPVILHEDSNPAHPTHGIRSIGQMTLDQVKELDAGLWFGEKHRGERIPTLGQALDAIAPRGLAIVELKWSAVALGNDNLERASATVIADAPHPENLVVSSFHPLALYRMARLAPGVPRALIHHQQMPLYLRRAWLRFLARPQGMHPECRMVTPRYVTWARRQRYQIIAWHTEEPDEMRHLSALGVDGIMTNKPDVLRQVVG